MSYNKYCNQDLWCANSNKKLCDVRGVTDKELNFLRKNTGFFALKSSQNNRQCIDNYNYVVNFKRGNYLNINQTKMRQVQSNKKLINKVIELFVLLYIITDKLNKSYPENNYGLHEVLVLTCKIRYFICINFISLNTFLSTFRGKILNRIEELTGDNDIFYKNFPDYIAIIYLTRNERREKVYQIIKQQDHSNLSNDDIDLRVSSFEIGYSMDCNINENQINNLIKVLNNPNKITARKLNYLRNK